MNVLYFLLLVLGLVCFAAKVAGVRTTVDLVAAGLACWILVSVIEMAQVL